MCLVPQLKAVQNETHKLSFQTYKGKNYYCYLEENNELADELSQRRKFQMMSDKIARRSSTEKMQVSRIPLHALLHCRLKPP